MAKEGVMRKDIGERLNISQVTVIDVLGKEGLSLQARHEKIFHMARQGIPFETIAEEAGCTVLTVKRILREARREAEKQAREQSAEKSQQD